MNGGGDAERKVWQQDWDDEEDEEDFGAKLRQQLGMWWVNAPEFFDVHMP